MNGNPLIGTIIDECWHNKYATVSELAAHPRMLLSEGTDAVKSSGSSRKESSEMATPVDRKCSREEFLSKKEFCQDLEKRGLLRVVSSGEPEQIGFKFEWYRHSLPVE